MGANRQMRRQQERNQVRAWKQQGQYQQMLSLQRNGITEKDLDKAYKNGYEEGYMYSATNFFRQMYAAIAKELIEDGNGTDEILSFLHGVDHRFSVMFDADEEIEDVYNAIGVRINVQKDGSTIDRIGEVVING